MEESEAFGIITGYISEQLELDDYQKIESIEQNAGSLWITLTGGIVKSIMIIDCELLENEEDK